MVDAITTEIIRHSLHAATEEAARNLCRTAYNTIVYEIHDYGITLHDRSGYGIAEAVGIAIFSGGNEYGVQRIIEFLGPESLEPGDVIMLNYPYWSAAHTLDVLVVQPAFHEGELIGFASCRVHLLDLMQKDPGYVSDSTDMFQEGIFFPAVKIYERGEIRNDIFNIIRFNSRMPERTIGDLQAEVSAVNTGVRRMTEIAERYGRDTLSDAMEAISEHGERLSRAAVSRLPDGTWSAFDFVDTDGIDLDELVRMDVTVTVDGEEMTIDWRETREPAKGPINLPFAMTRAASQLAFKAVTTPDSPICAGNFRNLTVLTTEGSLMHATPPMPTFTMWPGLLAPEVVLKALAVGMPNEIPACSGGDVCDVMALGMNPRTGQAWLEATNDAVGFGAHAGGDGEDGIMHMTEPGCRNNPIEVLESKGPTVIDRYGFRPDTGGPGKHRGGVGIERHYRFLADTTAIVINYKTRVEPWGVAGGANGVSNRVVVHPGTDGERDVTASSNAFGPGGRIHNLTGGGGGWGDPFEREPQAVVEDVRQGYVSVESARRDYGVVVDPDTHALDEDATAEARTGARA
jgi:N-methylhydantoinase B